MPIERRCAVNAHQVTGSSSFTGLDNIIYIIISHATFVLYRLVDSLFDITIFVVVVDKCLPHRMPQLVFAGDTVVVTRPVGEGLVILHIDASIVEWGGDEIIPIEIVGTLEDVPLNDSIVERLIVVGTILPQTRHAACCLVNVRPDWNIGSRCGSRGVEELVAACKTNAPVEPGCSTTGLNTKVLGEADHVA